MKNTKILALLLILFGFLSCNDLDEELFSAYSADNFYKNEDQLLTQTMSVYSPFRTTTWEQDAYFLTIYPGRFATSRGNDTYVNHAIYATNQLEPVRYERVWRALYDAIAKANTVIKYAPTSPLNAKTPALVSRYVAEARWMRAYCYFQLVQFWGNVPIYTEPVESTDNDVLFKGRSPVQEVYDLIIEDLLFANSNLPVTWTNTGRGRAVKATAAFLLGKVYLTSAGLPLNKKENYKKAIDVLKPLADNPALFDVALETNWRNIFSINNEANKEIIFSHAHNYEVGNGGVLPFWANPSGSLLGGVISTTGAGYLIAWNPEILLLFDATDVRRTEGFTYTFANRLGVSTTYVTTDTGPNPAGRYAGRNGICSTKYIDPGSTGNTNHSKDFIVYRYADVFLMLAEAYNEDGKAALALPYLKTIRDRVRATTAITTTEYDPLKNIIRTERLRELFGEPGDLFDFRRWGTAELEFNENRLRRWKQPTKTWEPKFILSPLPEIELAKNPKLLPNNPGW